MAIAIDKALETLSRIERPARLVVETVLAAVVALIVARLFWLISYPSDAVASFTDRPLATPISGLSGSASLSVDRTIILSSNPFVTDQVDEIVAAVPETSLNLQLDGLRMSNDQSVVGNAVIRTPRGEAQNFRVGDEIIAGVTLERILSDRVIINRDGASETLMLGGRQSGLSVIGDGSQVVAVSATTTADDPIATTAALPVEGQIAGPDVLFTAMNANLVRLDEGIEGYRLSARGDVAVMREAGFEPGDILLQINGTSVAEADLDELLERFGEVRTAIVRVSRDGTERTIRLKIGE